MENGSHGVVSALNGDTKQPFLIGVAGGTASGKVSKAAFVFSVRTGYLIDYVYVYFSRRCAKR